MRRLKSGHSQLMQLGRSEFSVDILPSLASQQLPPIQHPELLSPLAPSCWSLSYAFGARVKRGAGARTIPLGNFATTFGVVFTRVNSTHSLTLSHFLFFLSLFLTPPTFSPSFPEPLCRPPLDPSLPAHLLFHLLRRVSAAESPICRRLPSSILSPLSSTTLEWSVFPRCDPCVI